MESKENIEYIDKIKKMIESTETVKATEFNLFNLKNSWMYRYIVGNKKIIVFDDLINKMYLSSIINGQEGELDIDENSDYNDKYGYYYSIDNLYGFNRDELNKYNFLYSTEVQELKGRKYIIFVILDRVQKFPNRILYFAPIDYPKNTDLSFIQIIENYIYSTFYTVSETTQRRFITFLQRYCSEKENKCVKTKSYK